MAPSGSPAAHYHARPRYRPDIDGLRAIAVLAVVGFHAFPEWVTGGLVGVDVFFVISGFLISTIIFENLDKGTFSFAEFYARRIRRIFPALLLVLASCFAFGWFALLPDEYTRLSKHIAAGAGFVSNIVFWTEAGYFDSSAATKPLLHLWSLGVEEQFYLVWPLLLWLAWRLAPGRKRLGLLTVTLIVAGVSFYLNVATVTRDAAAAFYFPQTRFWELLSGAVLAWAMLFKRPAATIEPHLPPALSNVLSVSGLVLLAYAVWRINSTVGFPGAWALLPVRGAVAIILSGQRTWVNRTLLSNKVAVWIGLISYPLYLWHWPLLSFARILGDGFPSRNVRMAAVVVAIVLSWLTYTVAERPLRLATHGRIKVVALTAIMALVCSAGYFAYRRKGFRARGSIQGIEAMVEQNTEPVVTRESDGSCQDRLHLAVARTIVCLASSSNPDVLVLGDSHAMALNSAVHQGQVAADTLLIASHGCPPMIGYSVAAKGVIDATCADLANQAIDAIASVRSISTVVLASRGPLYFTGQGYGIEGASEFSIVPTGGDAGTQAGMFRDGTSNLVHRLTQLHKAVVYVIDPPELGINPSNCLFKTRLQTLLNSEASGCAQDKSRVLSRQALYRDVVAGVKADNPAMTIYDPLPLFCDDASCYGIRNGKLYYWDDDHISVAGSAAVLNDLFDKHLLPRL